VAKKPRFKGIPLNTHIGRSPNGHRLKADSDRWHDED